MPTQNDVTAQNAAAPDRRTHVRLRDLCDEVLASFRLASNGDLFTEQDRAEGRALLSQVAGSRA